MNEADTCRQHVVPKLQAAGWDDEPHSIAEQRTITDGRIVPQGQGFIRKPPKRVDYLLCYRRDFPLAVVEVKAAYKTVATGLQQAKDYASMLGLSFAYATNGHEILEFDAFTGLETLRSDYLTPTELWQRYRTGRGLEEPQTADRLLTPCKHLTDKGERYYQLIAINRTVEALLKGRRRLLLTMATGTGKTVVAFQICWKLWNARWNRTGEYRRPKILYLADRNILIDQPKDGIFATFEDARCKLEAGEAVHSRELYFAIYQALAEDERRLGLFRSFLPGFFDLIIVDECHRGSARDDSSWRRILDYFEPACQLGMTATPLRADNRDTYLYFGNPLYEYSLRQGIDDGLVPGALIKTKTQQICRTGELPVAEIDAKVGGFGLVPETLDGAIVSNHYFLFIYVSPEHPRLHCGPNVAKLTPKRTINHRYLVVVLQAPVVQDQIREITKLTAQPNLSMKTIRKLRLPVPPLPDQRRIVAELDALQAQVDALKRLQTETAAELDALLPAILDKAFKGEL